MIASGTGSTMSGEDAFKLSDTYGFPLDLTREILAERGMDVDEARFHELIAEQRKRAREARKDAGADAWKATGGAHGDCRPRSLWAMKRSVRKARCSPL